MTLRRKLQRIATRSKRLFSKHPSRRREAVEKEEWRRRWMLPIGHALVLLFGVGLAWQACRVKRLS